MKEITLTLQVPDDCAAALDPDFNKDAFEEMMERAHAGAFLANAVLDKFVDGGAGYHICPEGRSHREHVRSDMYRTWRGPSEVQEAFGQPGRKSRADSRRV